MSPRRSSSGSRVSARRGPSRSGQPKARTAIGQHFLVDADALARIVRAAALQPGDVVLEVGAGRGALTAELATTGAAVAAVELDEALCSLLRSRFASMPSVRVINANVLDYQPAALLSEASMAPPYAVVANIPYYITAPLLRHFLEAAVPPRRLILTVQREVAETIVAKVGALSLLSVSVQFFATAELLFRLPPAAFQPPPRVDSAVVRIDVAARPRVEVPDREAFFSLVRAGFRQPRKQIHNALSQGLWMPPGEAALLLQEAGIDPLRRAQTLALEEWRAVTEAYSRRRESWQPLAADGDDTASGEP